jgi:geranylgeranyl diphosphate synthase type II
MGAISAGQNAQDWTDLGAYIGEAFQVADDLRDVLCTTDELGKPIGQDALNNRPNAVARLGVKGAMEKLNDILACAIASIPACPGEQALAKMVRMQADSIMPSAEIVQRA